MHAPHAPLCNPPTILCKQLNKVTTVSSMCETEHNFGLADYRADHGCQRGNSHGEIHGHMLEDERGSVSSLFAKVLRTDDTEHISYSCLYLPCSFAHLLALLDFPFFSQSCPFCSRSLFASYPSAGRERGALLLKA